MSTINVTNLSGRGGATPNLPDGANITGVATATTFSGTLDGSLKSTGTPTLGLGVTINSSGLHVTGVTTVGVVTGGTFYGDGSNLTGVGDTIAPHFYNPSINGTNIDRDTGIGITFNKKIVAGSGTATIKIVNAGVAGTTIQSWGISSATIGITDLTLGALVSDLDAEQTFQLDIPSGFVKDGSDTNYVGTAYTFATKEQTFQLFTVGSNNQGELAQNSRTEYSSPVQIPGTTWSDVPRGYASGANPLFRGAIKTDGTLWTWGGTNSRGWLGQNNATACSSPTQVPGTTWSTVFAGLEQMHAVKTDGTLWGWGTNENGVLAQNTDTGGISSPVQVYGGGTTWSQLPNKLGTGSRSAFAIKTDGTLWTWGINTAGVLGLNAPVNSDKSSPTQIPGTTWSKIASGGGQNATGVIKTDGTLWTWGANSEGVLGHNLPQNTDKSSPTQVPGTTWARIECAKYQSMAVKTDGTLWMWGQNDFGELGQNNQVTLSSPTQIPGTTWSQTEFGSHENFSYAVKTDGTLWAWGENDSGFLGQNGPGNADYSSPVQIPGTTWTKVSGQSVFMRETP
jgi:alpha-tubulin suppressor-like RCC1 family protein